MSARVMNQNGNLRTIRFATPNIRLEADCIILDVFDQDQVNQGNDTWVNAGDPRHVTSAQLSKNLKISPVTYVIDEENGLAAYDLFSVIFAPVYDDFATAAETFLEQFGVFTPPQS